MNHRVTHWSNECSLNTNVMNEEREFIKKKIGEIVGDARKEIEGIIKTEHELSIIIFVCNTTKTK